MNAHDDATARQARSETRLEALGVPVNRGLPRIESESEVRLREPAAVARRALALLAVAEVGQGAPRDSVIASLQRSGLWAEVTPHERAFLGDSAPSEQALVNAGWRVEAIWTLLWALDAVETLALPRDQCDLRRISDLLGPHREDPETFVRQARLRPAREILDETDLIYRMHWAVRQAGLEGREPPAGLDAGIVMERHYALNWLTFYEDAWDDITTDT